MMHARIDLAQRLGLVMVAVLIAGLSLSSMARADDVHYIYTDASGSVLAVTDASGAVVSSMDYKPYGQQEMQDTGVAVGFSGQVTDGDTGLVYMRARFYDPLAGRFLSVDPKEISEGDAMSLNRYAYAADNPIGNSDPSGSESCGVWACETYDSGNDDGSITRGDDPIVTPESRIAFLKNYLSAAQRVATAAHITVAELLGVSGIESKWGLSRFARLGKNFFGLHAPAKGNLKGSNGKMKALDGDVYESTFPDFETSAQAFVDHEPFIVGVTDVPTFARLLQEQGKFGINMKTHQPLPDYQPSLISTIRHIEKDIARGNLTR